MRIGMVCPYSFDVPGGVQSHVLQLAEVMRERGHEVSVLAPFSPHVELPDYVVSGGKAVPIPYNGSVARLRFGPATHRKVKRWLADGEFDVLHLHEPNAPSLSMLALQAAEGPIVATFHTSTTKSLTLSVFQGILRPYHEKIVGRIAVSDLARRWQMEALGSDAVEIPNGVDVASFAEAPRLDGYPRPGGSVLFLGRYDEPRKGMAVLVGALPALVKRFPDIEVLIVGRGDEDELARRSANWPATSVSWVRSTTPTKASAMRSADVYCAPNTGGESFGIVLVEAMAAGTPVVASDLDAFRRVLLDGKAGRLVPVDDSDALAEALIAVLADDKLRAGYVKAASVAVRRYDWSVVADQIMRVYETVAGSGAKVRVAGADGRGWAVVLVVDRGTGRGAAVDRRLGLPDRDPAGPPSRPLRPVLAGDGRRAGPSRGGGPRGGRRRLPPPSRGPTAGRAGRRRRTRPPRRARGGRERAVGGAGDGRPVGDPGGPGSRAGRCRGAGAAGPPVPQRRRARHPRVTRTPPGPVAATGRNRPATELLRDRRAGGHRGGPARGRRVDRRTSARVILLDDAGAVLLFCGSDPAIIDGTAPRWWFTVGGQAHPGERLVDTAVREIAEETGLHVEPAQMVGPVWRRDSVIDFNGTVIQSQEFYFLHRTSRFEPTARGRTALELRYIHGHRWCDSAAIEKLAAGGETVYPLQLGELLAEANVMADDRGGGPPAELQPIR